MSLSCLKECGFFHPVYRMTRDPTKKSFKRTSNKRTQGHAYVAGGMAKVLKLRESLEVLVRFTAQDSRDLGFEVGIPTSGSKGPFFLIWGADGEGERVACGALGESAGFAWASWALGAQSLRGRSDADVAVRPRLRFPEGEPFSQRSATVGLALSSPSQGF